MAALGTPDPRTAPAGLRRPPGAPVVLIATVALLVPFLVIALLRRDLPVRGALIAVGVIWLLLLFVRFAARRRERL